jgi:RHS repeat-associated protein
VPDYGFAQKEADRESGLQFFEARYLAGSLARFLSADPLKLNASAGNPQGFHPYAYTANNPLRRLDPMGLDLWDWAGDVAGGAWSYAAEKVDYVVENPGKTVAIVFVGTVTAPVTGGAALIYGVGSTAYGAADSLIQAATGEDFSSDGYQSLSDKQRREQLGRGIVQSVETGVQIAGAKSVPKNVVPKKNFSPAAHAKTQPVWVVDKTQPVWVVDKTQPGWVLGKTQMPPKTRAEANVQIQLHNNFILREVKRRGGIVSAKTYKAIERAADFWIGKIDQFLD